MPRASVPRAIAAAALVAVAAGCSPARTVEAVGLLRDVASPDVAGPEAPAGVARREVAYGADRRAHLYQRPGARAALVLVPGAAAEALDDPRLMGFADSLSRRGFLVLVPELGDDSLQVSAADADAVVDAVTFLRAAEGTDEVGLAALSYAAGPTILAAARPGTAPHVGFVVTIGGYHDIVESITYITTGAFRDRPGAPWRLGPVDAAAKWVFLQANTRWVADPADARRLEEIAATRLAGADPAPLAARLGPEGRRVLALFVNTDPDRVPSLIADLPPRMRAEIEALDLARADLAGLRAELILVHGLNDALVPHTESRALATRLGPGRAPGRGGRAPGRRRASAS